MNYDRTVSNEMIARMVRRVEPNWRVEEATAAADGHHVVYFLDIETESGCRDCVLKATPQGKPPACGDEARLLSVLGAHSDLPVPEVYGVLDEHEDLPTPFFLASCLPGENYGRTDVTRLSDQVVEAVAHSSGRHLAALHDVDAVDGYGSVAVEREEPLRGGRPASDLGRVVVTDAFDAWEGYLRDSAAGTLDGLADTRFGDLRPNVRAALDRRIDALRGEFRPAIARIDHSLDNLLVDAVSGAVTGMVDWEFCLATTPGYDLAFVVHSLNGGLWATLPGVPDRREVIRTALLDGYRAAGGEPRGVDEFRENRECYALLAWTHAMLNFEDWFDLIGETDVRRAAAEEALRERVREYR